MIVINDVIVEMMADVLSWELWQVTSFFWLCGSIYLSFIHIPQMKLSSNLYLKFSRVYMFEIISNKERCPILPLQYVMLFAILKADKYQKLVIIKSLSHVFFLQVINSFSFCAHNTPDFS